MQTRFELLADKFGTAEEARGYAAELKHALSHPEERGLDKDQIYAANLIISQIKEYLAAMSEAL